MPGVCSYSKSPKSRSGRFGELLLFRGTFQRGGGARAGLDGLGHRVEIAGTDLALVLDRGEATVCGGEFALL